VPSLAGGARLLQKKRRVAIEIHGPERNNSNDNNNNNNNNDDSNNRNNKRRSTAPPGRGLTRNSLANNTKGSRAIIDLSKELKDDDRIVIRIFKSRKAWGFSRDTDDSSSSSSSEEVDASESSSSEAPDLFEIEDGWVEYRKSKRRNDFFFGYNMC
jgi:hypothetical protein